MAYQVILGIIAAAIGAGGFIPYLQDILKKRTKPHAFSWFIWGVIQVAVFFAQLSKGGGAGAWLTGAGALGCLAIFAIALPRGEKEITGLDKACLFSALFGMALWAITSDPLGTVIIAALVDALGFVPTFRKAYKKPMEETLKTYAMNVISFSISLFALQALNYTTAIYPASLVLTNGLFVAMVMIRRRRKQHGL